MPFHALVISHLEYSAFFLFQISSTLLLSLEKQMNWALKCVFFRSRIKSNELRKRKNLISIIQLIELITLTYYLRYIRNMKTAFQKHLKLPTASYRINKRTTK